MNERISLRTMYKLELDRSGLLEWILSGHCVLNKVVAVVVVADLGLSGVKVRANFQSLRTQACRSRSQPAAPRTHMGGPRNASYLQRLSQEGYRSRRSSRLLGAARTEY